MRKGRVYRGYRTFLKRRIGPGLVWVWQPLSWSFTKRLGWSHALPGGYPVPWMEVDRSTRNGVYLKVGKVAILVCWRRVGDWWR